MFDSLILGLAQGVFEWLPVSSEGVTVALLSISSDMPVTNIIRYALWLHIGTCLSATIVFRHRIYRLLLHALDIKSCMRNPEILFLVASTLTSFCVGGVILLTIEILLDKIGLLAVSSVGLCMIITGIVQVKRRSSAHKQLIDLTVADALIVGIAQGFAVVPGFSRSGFTVAALVWRGYGFKDCLELSMLMSIPAGLGAASVVVATSALTFELEMVVAAGVAAGSGLVAIRVLLVFAQRVNLGVLVMISGLLMLVAGISLGT